MLTLMLMGLFSEVVEPRQSLRLSFGVDKLAQTTGSDETFEFVARKLRDIVLGNKADPSEPPPIEVECRHLAQVSPASHANSRAPNDPTHFPPCSSTHARSKHRRSGTSSTAPGGTSARARPRPHTRTSRLAPSGPSSRCTTRTRSTSSYSGTCPRRGARATCSSRACTSVRGTRR